MASERITFIWPLSVPKLLSMPQMASRMLRSTLIALLDRGEQVGFLGLHAAPAVDADLGDRLAQILRGRRGEFRLVVGELEHVGIGIADAGEGAGRISGAECRPPWRAATVSG